MELDEAVKNRQSLREFGRKKPDWRDIIECIDSARFAPMAGNNYTPRWILVDDKEKIQKIAEAAQQFFIAQAKYVVVVCSVPGRTLNAYEKQGERYIRQQAGAAIQNFLLKIEEKRLATCWVGHFVESLIKRALKIPADIYVEAVFPIGYPPTKKYAKRLNVNLDSILYFNKYKNKEMEKPKTLEV